MGFWPSALLFLLLAGIVCQTASELLDTPCVQIGAADCRQATNASEPWNAHCGSRIFSVFENDDNWASGLPAEAISKLATSWLCAAQALTLESLQVMHSRFSMVAPFRA